MNVRKCARCGKPLKLGGAYTWRKLPNGTVIYLAGKACEAAWDAEHSEVER